MKKFSALVLALAMVLSLVGCGNSDSASKSTPAAGGFEKMTIKVSYSTGDNGMDGIACAKLKELVSEKTNGAVTIEGYGNAQLASGDMDRMVELAPSCRLCCRTAPKKRPSMPGRPCPIRRPPCAANLKRTA